MDDDARVRPVQGRSLRDLDACGPDTIVVPSDGTLENPRAAERRGSADLLTEACVTAGRWILRLDRRAPAPGRSRRCGRTPTPHGDVLHAGHLIGHRRRAEDRAVV